MSKRYSGDDDNSRGERGGSRGGRGGSRGGRGGRERGREGTRGQERGGRNTSMFRKKRPGMSFVSGGFSGDGKDKKKKPKISFQPKKPAADSSSLSSAPCSASSALPAPTKPPPVVDTFAELLKSIGTDPEETRKEKERKERVETERKKKEERDANKPVAVDRNFGRWEKSTKGFGSKILAKFGFTGRLGKNASGIAKPIQVIRRKDGAGLGAVAESSTVNRENNVHLFGKDTVGQDKDNKKKGTASKRKRGYNSNNNNNVVRPMWQKRYNNTSSSAEDTTALPKRKRGKINRPDPRIRTAQDVMNLDNQDTHDDNGHSTRSAEAQPTRIEMILDMRGSATGRVVGSISEALSGPLITSSSSRHYETNVESNHNDNQVVTKGVHATLDVGRELRYNINKLKDMCEADLHRLNGELRTVEREDTVIAREIKQLELKRLAKESQCKEMSSIQTLIQRLMSHDVSIEGSAQHDEHGKQHSATSGPSFTHKKASSSSSSTASVMATTMMERNSEGASIFRTLIIDHADMYRSLKLNDLLESYVRPMVSKCLSLKLYDPNHAHQVVAPWWKAMVNSCLLRQKQNIPQNSLQNSLQKESFAHKADYNRIVGEALKDALNFDDYDIEHPERMLSIMEGIIRGDQTGAGALPLLGRELVVTEILPRLIRHLEHDWSYNVPCHLWIHPWLPLLHSSGGGGGKGRRKADDKVTTTEVHIKQLLRPVKQQLVRWYLTCWSPDVSTSSFQTKEGVDVVAPWTSLLSTTMLDDVVERGIMQVLSSSIMDKLDVANRETGGQLKNILQQWHPILGTARTAALLSGHFFPRWLCHLRSWLIDSYGRQEKWENHVLQWYESWISALPAEVKTHSLIKRHVGQALSMLNTATNQSTNTKSNHATEEAVGGALEHLLPNITNMTTTYDRILLRMRRENGFSSHGSNTFAQPSSSSSSNDNSTSPTATTHQRHDLSIGHHDHEESRNITSTFRDVVEMFAQEHGVSFLPKQGRTYRGQMLYTLDGVTCYLDRGVMFVRDQNSQNSQSDQSSQDNDSHEYTPMSLEDALQLRQVKMNEKAEKMKKMKMEHNERERENAKVKNIAGGADIDDLD